MSDIRIMEKPEDISFEEIRNVLQRAHSVNFKKGIFMHTTELSAGELEAYLGDDGKCYVAMDGGQIVGTLSYRTNLRRAWYAQEKFVEVVLVGVLPEYSGRHVFSSLFDEAEKYVKQKGFSLIVLNTAAKNKGMQSACIKQKLKYVSYFVAEDNDHYSVVMAKWLNGCPFSKVEMWLRYHKQKYYIFLRYKPGKIKRFGL